MDIKELESFELSDAIKFHDELNPALWTEKGDLDPEVKQRLMIIARDFMSEIGVSSYKVDDITISGSNAAYSYTPHSDLDLHILVDYDKLSNDEVYKELFNAKKTLYNDSHDIKVHGVPVELYVQDTNQIHASLGEYSLLKDKWNKYPVKRRANFDHDATRLKYEKLGELIELALKEQNIEKIEKVLDIIKRYRKAGLTTTGEFGPENLSFKALRKQGYIQKLYDLKQELHSRELSIENIQENKQKVIEGTNCVNCVWWKKDSEKPVGKDELNSNGGLKPPNKEYIAMSKRVDLVTLPGKDTVKVKGFCYHKDINDWVTERMCCAKWDAKGVIRDYKGESPLMENNQVDEVLDPSSAYNISWRDTNVNDIKVYNARAKDKQGDYLDIQFYDFDEYNLTGIEFSRGSAFHINKSGEQFNIFATVLQATKDYLSSIKKPKYILFGAKEKSRVRLYQAFVNRFANQFGYKEISKENIPDEVYSHIVGKNEVGFLLARTDKRYNVDIEEGGADTSWSDGNEKITLQDILELTKHIKQIDLPINDNLKSKLIHWDGNPKEIERINQVTISKQFPILVMLDKQGQIDWILDGNHRLHKAIQSQAKTIPAKLIRPGDLSDKARKVFHIEDQSVVEASGYIPSKKEKNDPRFKTALTIDVKPDSIKKNAKAFGFNVSRAGIPPLLRK
jgi:hypothetical protein